MLIKPFYDAGYKTVCCLSGKKWQNLGRRPQIKTLAQNAVFRNTGFTCPGEWRLGLCFLAHFLTGKTPNTPREAEGLRGNLPVAQAGGGQRCGTVTAAQSRSSPELHSMALHSLHIPFICNPEADGLSPHFSGQETETYDGECLGQRSVSKWQRWSQPPGVLPAVPSSCLSGRERANGPCQGEPA